MSLLEVFNLLVATYIGWRALTNLNAITRATCVSILAVNLTLVLGAACVVAAAMYGMDEYAELGHGLIAATLVALMYVGRRESDRVAPRARPHGMES